jgi:GTP-binding protein YchF
VVFIYQGPFTIHKYSFIIFSSIQCAACFFISYTCLLLLDNRIFAPLKIKLMKAGIVGLPNVGKSTLFNCLSNAKAQSANFPFCTIEPNIGVVNVPDSRLQKLEELVNPERVMPATVEIVDIAGLVKGASKGEGLGNKFLGNIRETDAIIHVLRCFDNDNIIHVDTTIDPIRDKETIDVELQLKDLESVEKKLEKVKKAARTGNKEAQKEFDTLTKVVNGLEGFNSVRAIELTEDEREEFVKPLQLLTDKPILYVCNVDEESAVNGNAYVDRVKEVVKDENAEVIILAVGTEADITELEEYEERQMFLEDLGLNEAGASKLIRAAYKLLNLQTYFTAGVKEVRAWTINVGDTAPQAAGVIHTDFEKGFIRAEVIKYKDFVSLGSEVKVREAGKLGVEGKEYIVQDGDMMNFRFNV